MSEETNFDDYNASQITPQYTLLEKFNKIIEWLKGTKKEDPVPAPTNVYKHKISFKVIANGLTQYIEGEAGINVQFLITSTKDTYNLNEIKNMIADTSMCCKCLYTPSGAPAEIRFGTMGIMGLADDDNAIMLMINGSWHLGNIVNYSNFSDVVAN